MPNLYYIEVNGRREGPYTPDQLRSHWNTGKIPVEAFYWQDGMDDWRSLREITPLLGGAAGKSLPPSPLRRQNDRVSPSMQKLAWVALRLTFLFAMVSIFLPAVSVNVPIFGAVEASVFEMFTDKQEVLPKDNGSIQKPNFQEMIKGEKSLDKIIEKPGVIFCAVAMIGLLGAYATSLIWAIFGFIVRIRVPGLEALWLLLACQFPVMLMIGGRMVVKDVISEFNREMAVKGGDNSLAALGGVFLNNLSVAPGVAMWGLMGASLITLVLSRTTKPTQ